MRAEIDFIVWLQSFSSPVLDVVAKITSYFFNYPMAVLVALLFFFLYDKKYGIFFGIVTAVSAGIQFCLKLLFNRPRPYLASVEVQNIYQALGSSFPSGHSVTAMGIALFVGLVVFKSHLSKTKKGLIYGGLAVYLLLNLLNRTYLGQHYLTDIFAGFALMVIIFVVSLWIYPYFCKACNKLIKKSKRENQNG